MSSPPIQRSLERHFAKHRVVFWYDGKGEWSKDLEQLELPDIELIRVENNEIGVKFRVLLEEPKTKFLLYVPTDQPNHEDNWLADILLSHAEFHADRASLHLQETGLPHEYRELADEHAAFFSRKERRELLKAKIQEDETHRSIRRRMMAIVLKAQDHSLDAILLRLCESLSGAELFDPVVEAFNEFTLVEAFWKEVETQYGYHSANRSLLDFVIGLFQHNAPLGTTVKSGLRSQAVVFLSRWKDSNSSRQSFESLSNRTATNLNIAAALNQVSEKDIQALVDAEVDAYELIEKRVVCWFRDGVKARRWKSDARRAIIEKRARSFWFSKYETLYEALNHGAELLDLVEAVDFKVNNIEQGINRYRSAWWRIDFHYRKFHGYRRESTQPGLLDEIEDEVERRYLNEYLNPLATRWESLLDSQPTWPPAMQSQSRDFFNQVVKPGSENQQKLFVIISDGFRYECAAELRNRILKEDRFSAEIESRLAPLPSYTQLGMAALLPNTQLAISEDSNIAFADGASTVGTENRTKILNRQPGLKVKVLSAEEFLDMHTKNEGRPMMKEFDVVYIYHNEIDKVGDDLKTEAQLATACDAAIATVIKLVKKAANINASNIVVTADHGFLFRQSKVEDADCTDAPHAQLLGNPHRRFVTGRGITADSTIRVYPVSALGLEGDFEVGIAKGMQRFKVRGSGKRYVHGGAMPQEVIVPVLSINKARVSDTRLVEVEIQSFPSRITTMQVAVRLFQKQVVSDADKMLGRELELGIFSLDGELLSDQKPVRFELTDPEPRNREVIIQLTLGHRVTDFNNQDLELRLTEKIGETSHRKVYEKATAKFAKPFESEIDEF
jgi:uncharacterized protein (TIGR02687 family)